MRYKLEHLLKDANNTQVEINGKWVPARPERYFYLSGLLHRIKDAWLVLTDKADAVIWPEGQ